MFNTTCNTTLADLRSKLMWSQLIRKLADDPCAVVEEPLAAGLTFHELGLILSGACGLASVLISLWLIYKHATHYLRPWEQKQYVSLAPAPIFILTGISASFEFCSWYPSTPLYPSSPSTFTDTAYITKSCGTVTRPLRLQVSSHSCATTYSQRYTTKKSIFGK